MLIPAGLLDGNGQLLLERAILSTPGDASLSFLGVSFTESEVARVRLTVGENLLGANDLTQGGSDDLVVVDDFIYGEPVLVSPKAPLISTPNDNDTLMVSLPLISGVAEVDSVIELFDASDSIGMTTTGSDGTWSLTPD